MQALIWQLIYLALSMTGFVAFFVGAFASIARETATHPSSAGSPPMFFLFFPLIWLIMMGGWLASLILGIVYGIRANRGEWAAYPVIGRWARRIVGV